MKYSIEYQNGKFVETLEVDSHVTTKTWKRNGMGLCSNDRDFAEQLEECLDEEVLDHIADLFDGCMMVSDIEEFIIDTQVE